MKDQRVENWLAQHKVEWDYWESVPLARIDAGRSLRNQARLDKALDDETVEQYAEAMNRGDVFPALIAYLATSRDKLAPGADLVLITGNHRMAAAVATGRQEFDCYVVQTTNADVRERLTRTANFVEGRRPTKQEAILHAMWLVNRSSYTAATAAGLAQLNPELLTRNLRAERIRGRLMAMGLDPAPLPLATLIDMHVLQLDAVLRAAARATLEFAMREEDVRDMLRTVRMVRSEEEQLARIRAFTEQDYIKMKRETTAAGRLGRRMTPANRLLGSLTTTRNIVTRYTTPDLAEVRSATEFDKVVATWQEIQSDMGQWLQLGRKKWGLASEHAGGAEHGDGTPRRRARQTA